MRWIEETNNIERLLSVLYWWVFFFSYVCSDPVIVKVQLCGRIISLLRSLKMAAKEARISFVYHTLVLIKIHNNKARFQKELDEYSKGLLPSIDRYSVSSSDSQNWCSRLLITQTFKGNSERFQLNVPKTN